MVYAAPSVFPTHRVRPEMPVTHRAFRDTRMATAEEQRALELARTGDRKAFGDLVRLHHRRMWKVAVHMLGNAAEADDVVQETFLRAFRGLDRFDGRAELSTWLYRIVVNLSLNALRARSRAGGVDVDDPRLGSALVAEGDDPAAAADVRRRTLQLLRALEQLSVTLRTTVVLVAIEGLGHREAAEVLGCAEGTVAWRMHEARRLLKDRLAGNADEKPAREDERA